MKYLGHALILFALVASMVLVASFVSLGAVIGVLVGSIFSFCLITMGVIK